MIYNYKIKAQVKKKMIPNKHDDYWIKYNFFTEICHSTHLFAIASIYRLSKVTKLNGINC